MNEPHSLRTDNPEEILLARARALAAEEDRSDDGDRLPILTFRLAKETYGIELRHISGVHPLKNVSYIPGVPDFILGITNMRGEILSVVDLKKIFGLDHGESGDGKMVIILKNTEMEFCLTADEIIDVRLISPDEITASLPTLTGIYSDYLHGVCRDGMVIIDGHKLLSAPEMRIDIVS